jgi:hypothetical protein
MRPTVVLLTSALLLATCSGAVTGADDPRTAVDAYLAAMDKNDESALRKVLSEPHGEEVEPHLSERGGKALQVESVDVTQGFGPKVAFAHVQGTYADSSRYDERIVVSKIDDRWYVTIPGPVRVPPGGKQPSVATR